MSEYEPGEGTRESDRHAEVSVVMPCQSTRGANRPVPKCAADPDGGESTRREQAIGGGAADGESVGCLVRLQQKSIPEHLRLTKATQNLDQPYADRIMSKSSLGTI